MITNYLKSLNAKEPDLVVQILTKEQIDVLLTDEAKQAAERIGAQIQLARLEGAL